MDSYDHCIMHSKYYDSSIYYILVVVLAVLVLSSISISMHCYTYRVNI
jgi:hypothetical protein